jgi:hypothetical protein
MKQQWRMLRNKVEYHDPLIIEYAMHTCCMLHNMLLQYKEYDTFSWDSVDPDKDEGIHDEAVPEDEELELLTPARGMAHIPELGEMTQRHNGIIPYHPCRYDELRHALVVHFTQQFLAGKKLVFTALFHFLFITIFYLLLYYYYTYYCTYYSTYYSIYYSTYYYFTYVQGNSAGLAASQLRSGSGSPSAAHSAYYNEQCR